MNGVNLTRIKRAGEGAYGIVYLATGQESNGKKKFSSKEIKAIPEEDLYAVKRNFKDGDTFGYGNLREFNIMNILRGHPYIIDLVEVLTHDPFSKKGRPMTPIAKTEFKSMEEDQMRFVMEYLPLNGEEYISDKSYTAFGVKVLITQLLLAIEFMHAKGVVHRDIRTSNILVSVDDDGNHMLKLCDFGLSRVMGDGICTPGVVTSLYRPPEICCGAPYNRKADIWSAGCVIYELMCGTSLLKGVDDDNTNLFNNILIKLPTAVPQEEIDHMLKNCDEMEIQPNKYRRKRLIDRMNLDKDFVRDFKSVPGSLSELEDVLSHMLCFNPRDRHSATRLLNHPFFNWTRKHITQMRAEHIPEPEALPFYEIYPCIERKWVAELIPHLCGKGDLLVINPSYLPTKTRNVYVDRVVFHALDLFDQYLAHRFTVNPDKLRAEETALLGRIHSREETYLRWYCCVYMIHKYYATLTPTLKWEEIAPKMFVSIKNKRLAMEFENLMALTITGGLLFRKTLLEISYDFEDQMSSAQHAENLTKLLELKENYVTGSVRALYREFNGIKSQPAIS
jgi:serine/threonine protein kinase